MTSIESMRWSVEAMASLRLGLGLEEDEEPKRRFISSEGGRGGVGPAEEESAEGQKERGMLLIVLVDSPRSLLSWLADHKPRTDAD